MNRTSAYINIYSQKNSLHTSATFFGYAVGLTVALALSALIGILNPTNAGASCVAPATAYGSVTYSVNAAQAATYRVWSRVKVPDTTNTSFLLEIDGGNCFNVGGNPNIPTNTWTWLDYQAGGAKINVALTAGAHSIKVLGNKPNVQLDRIILTADSSCVPKLSTFGDNCASPADTVPPTVKLVEPTAGAQLRDVAKMSVVASDDAGGTGMTKTEYFIDGVLVSTSTTAPSYSASVDTAKLSNGTHTLFAKAYDGAGNSAKTADMNIQINNGDSIKPTVSLKGVSASATVSGAIPVEATVSDNVGVAKVDFYIDGALQKSELFAPYCLLEVSGACKGYSSQTLANGSHTIKAIASDAAGNTNSSSVTFNVDNADRTAPTVAITGTLYGDVVSGNIPFEAIASDNVGITKVDFYVDGVLHNTELDGPYCMVQANSACTGWNSTKVSNGTHTISAVAYDANANKASANTVVEVRNGDTQIPTAPSDLKLTTNSANNVSLSWLKSSDNVAVAKYCILRNNFPHACVEASTNVYSDGAVLPGTTYAYKVYALDQAGNRSAMSAVSTITTPAVADTIAPASPQAVTATAVSSTQINVTWKASTDNVAVLAYDVYKNNQKVTSTTSLSYGAANLTANTAYTYYVVARDSAGNTSAKSEVVRARTSPIPQQTGAVEGTVRAESGGVPYLFIGVTSNGSSKYYSAYLFGKYRVANLAPGNYTFDYITGRYPIVRKSLLVEPNRTLKQNIQFTRK